MRIVVPQEGGRYYGVLPNTRTSTNERVDAEFEKKIGAWAEANLGESKQEESGVHSTGSDGVFS